MLRTFNQVAKWWAIGLDSTLEPWAAIIVLMGMSGAASTLVGTAVKTASQRHAAMTRAQRLKRVFRIEDDLSVSKDFPNRKARALLSAKVAIAVSWTPVPVRSHTVISSSD